jgi:hypothetical protein
MKKIMALFVIFSFMAGVAALRPAAAAEREKILSPDQIKNYREIIKQGAALFGIKMEKKENKSGSGNVKVETGDEVSATSTGAEVETGSDAATSTGEKLEKILTPAHIALFEKIKKVGTALWGVKKIEDRSSGKAMPASGRLIVSADMSDCVAAAIDVKDKALIERASVAATALTTAISSRSACQQEAIKSTTNQIGALNVCVKTFKDGLKQIREKNKESQKSAWNAYKDSLKTCRANSQATTTTDLIIEDGSEDALELLAE